MARLKFELLSTAEALYVASTSGVERSLCQPQSMSNSDVLHRDLQILEPQSKRALRVRIEILGPNLGIRELG
jgi:hypothetical protein